MEREASREEGRAWFLNGLSAYSEYILAYLVTDLGRRRGGEMEALCCKKGYDTNPRTMSVATDSRR